MRKIMIACALFASAFFARAYDIMATVSIEGETRWYFDIGLSNNDIDFTAFQLDVTLDGEAELVEGELKTSELIPNHTLMVARPDGHYRVLGFSMSNSSLTGTTGQLFSFAIDGDIKGITINKIIFAKPDGTEVEADVYEKALDRTDEDAIADVSAAQKENKVVYDMQGKQVYRIDRRGIYIQNGKKVVVK